MKVIDIMQKVANKEIFKFRIDDVNYYVDKSNCIREEDGTKVEWDIDDEWLNRCIDDEWLNMNAEIIEEDKKIEKLTIGKDDVAWCEGNMKTDEEMVDIVLEIKDKINEIIDYIMEEK